MGYHALLFCPDEKTARTVTQVLSELDFAVTPSTEPFGAVKKLMGEHFDAVVVDCDNEQNATLLFKSARNTVHNQSSLAVAVVEGQAGVAKAFRIGANLVLTKPINVEQAKGTLRVARGLLRKNEGAKPAAATPASVKPSTTILPPKAEESISHVEAPLPAQRSAPLMTGAAASAQSAKLASVPAADVRYNSESVAEPFKPTAEEIVTPAIAESAGQLHRPQPSADVAETKSELTPSRIGFGTSAASAAAPAREPLPAIETKTSAVPSQGESKEKLAEVKDTAGPISGASARVPTFTFGGTISSEAESASGGSKKWLLATVAVLVIAAASYWAWAHWGGQANDNKSVSVVESPVKTPTAVPQVPPGSALVAATVRPDVATSEVTEKAPSHPNKITAATDSSKPSPSAGATETTATPKEDAQPIIIKNNHTKAATKSVATNDAPAPPSIAGIAPAGNGGELPNLMDNPSNAPTPILQRLNVSQGVSRGLLVKEVAPKYPPNALRLRVEGSVQLLATVSKDGDISAVKILSGDQQLAHAATDAVKQWKYKPYLLNGSPVEIQTQITVNFKLPK